MSGWIIWCVWLIIYVYAHLLDCLSTTHHLTFSTIWVYLGCRNSGIDHPTWWLIPLSKWVITPVINGISRVNPLTIGVITHLLSGMSHQVHIYNWFSLSISISIYIHTPCIDEISWHLGQEKIAPWDQYEVNEVNLDISLVTNIL